jgi:hypothetical protein
MRFFTRDLYQRCRSNDEDVLDAACAEWEQANERYAQHLHALQSRLPEHLREFSSLLLHDARVQSIARLDQRLIMVLHKEIPPRDVVVLDYDLESEPILEPFLESPTDWSRPTDFQFDELDLGAEGVRPLFSQSIVFGNGWLMRLGFSDVRVTLARPAIPDFGIFAPAALGRTG